MRFVARALFICACLAATSGRAPAGRVIDVATAAELMGALRAPLDDVTIRLAPGYYVPAPASRQVRTLACEDNVEIRTVTVGLVVSGRRVRLLGPAHGSAVVHADASYQVLFDNCTDCAVERVTIVSDVSDRMRHEGAAICAIQSAVRVAHCVIRDNGPVMRADAGLLKSVKGICGRRADLVIEFNEIVGNAWGIVLYDHSRSFISNNRVEGTGAMRAGGSAVLVTCKAEATVERNHFRAFTNGIEISGASVACKNNIIEDVYGDGVAANSQGLGRVSIEQNVIYRCGAAGMTVRADGDQKASRNIIAETGRVSPRASTIHVLGARADAAIRKNTLYDNTVLDPALDRDVPREIFWRARKKWTRTYRNTPVGVDGRHKFYESAFLTRYGRWAD